MKFRNGEKHALRDGFGRGLLQAAKNKKVFALSADLTESNRMNWFQEKHPERFIEVGVAEQNLIGLGAGLAHTGMVPFCGSFAVFSPGRSWDQIRVSVCYSNLNVKLYGGHAGLTVGEDGATHQALEDVAITRVLPNMTVIVPCDAEEMRRATRASVTHKGPVYLRGGRPKIPVISEAHPFRIGKANVVRRGVDVTIVACGLMVGRSLEAAEILEKQGVSCEVINCHTIKPFDYETVLKSVRKTGCVVTAEEHQINGGLGSVVAETLAEEYPVHLWRLGVQDTFGETGKWEELLEKHKLTMQGVIEAVHKVKK